KSTFLENQLNINDLYNYEVVTGSSLKMENSYIQCYKHSINAIYTVFVPLYSFSIISFIKFFNNSSALFFLSIALLISLETSFILSSNSEVTNGIFIFFSCSILNIGLAPPIA